MARPTKISKKIVDTLAKYIRAGAHLDTAAARAGISKQTLHTWLKAAARGDGTPLQNDLLEAVDLALADFEHGAVLGIMKASTTQWQAGAWLLERKFPDRYGMRNRTEITGANGGPIQLVDVKVMSDAELEAIVAKSRAGAGS